MNTSNIDTSDMNTSNIQLPRKPPSIEYIQGLHFQLRKQERNDLLQRTDKYVLPDYPLSEDQKNEIIAYRQLLRDYFERDDVKDWAFTYECQYPPDLPIPPSFVKV